MYIQQKNLLLEKYNHLSKVSLYAFRINNSKHDNCNKIYTNMELCFVWQYKGRAKAKKIFPGLYICTLFINLMFLY